MPERADGPPSDRLARVLAGVGAFVRARGIHVGMGSTQRCVTCGEPWPCPASEGRPMGNEPPSDSVDPFDPPLTDAEWEPFAAAVGIEPPSDSDDECTCGHADYTAAIHCPIHGRHADEPPSWPRPLRTGSGALLAWVDRDGRTVSPPTANEPPIVCAESSELRRKRLIDKLMTTAQEIQEMAQADMDPWADVMRDAADEIRMSERADDPPIVSDRFGAVFPDGAVYDATEGARLFDQDAEQRARSVAVKIGGRPCRIRTTIEWLPDA
jgi:hypothetical protein